MGRIHFRHLVSAAVTSALLLTLVPTATNATTLGSVRAAVPPATCATSSDGPNAGTCVLGPLTATTLTATVSFPYTNPRASSNPPAAGTFFQLYVAGAGYDCGGFSGYGSGYFLYTKVSAGSVTCTVTWSWTAGARPGSLGFTVLELDGWAIGMAGGSHYASVSFTRPPEAYFFADPTPSKPLGTFTFFGRAYTYQGRAPATYRWDFDDGSPVVTTTTTATSVQLEHRYKKSGTFDPTLIVTDSGGLISAVYTTRKVVAVPALLVAVSPVVPPGGLGLGDILDIPVAVTADRTIATGVGLRVTTSPAGILVVGALKPAATALSFTEGETKRFILRVRGGATGVGQIAVTASGLDGSATAVSGSGSGRVAVASKVLSVKAAPVSAKVALPVSAKGVVGPRTVKVRITLRNSGKARLTGVVLNRMYVRPVVRTDPLDQIDFARGTFPIRIGTINAGASVVKTLSLAMTGDGRYKFDSSASFTLGGRPELVVGEAGRVTTTVPPLWFDASMSGSSVRGTGKVDFVEGGSAFFLSGRIKNLSTYRHLCLWPLRPVLQGNAGGTGPVDLRVYGTGRDVVAPPVAGPLTPGESLPFAMQVRTRSDGGTRATVRLNPRATEIKAGASCNAVTVSATKPLSPNDVTLQPNSTLHVGGVDVSVPTVQPAGSLAVIGNFFGGFTIGSIATVADLMTGTLAAARESFSGYTTNPELLLPTTEALNATAALLVNYWETATPAEKAVLFGQVRSSLRRASGDAWKTLDQGVSGSFEGFMTKVEKAYATGDNRELAYALGYGSGNVVTQIGIDMVTAEIGVSFAKKIPALQRTFARLGGESVTFATMKDIPTGKLLNATEMRRLWGASLSDISAFKRIAREEDVLIGIRSRAPVSVKNLEGGAVWKHENLKPKNVNRIDIEYLGFNKADNGLVAMKKYSAAEKTAIEARIKKAPLTATQRAEVLDRLDTRFKEADKYLAKIEKFSKTGKIDVGFNYSENGIDLPTDAKLRKFKLTGEPQGGSTYYRPWQQNSARTFPPGTKLPSWCKNFGGTLGILCRVTGDMDGVYLTTRGGRQLPKEKLVRVYKKLAEAGWQHPETFTWTDQMTGKFFFDSKEKILKGLTKGGEKMMEFAPDGYVRATWIDLKKCYFWGGARSFYVARVGGVTALLK